MRVLFAAFALAVATSGCTTGGKRCDARSPAVAVPTPPPAPLTDITGDPPAHGMTLVDGHWHWDGVRWVWIPTRWVSVPPGQRWEAPEVSRDGGRTTFREGGFVCDPGE